MTKLGGGRGCLDAGTALGTTKVAPCVPVSCVDTERGGGAGVHAQVCTSVPVGGRACLHVCTRASWTHVQGTALCTGSCDACTPLCPREYTPVCAPAQGTPS